MTNQKKFVYVSLLPLIVIVGLILGAGYFLLADEIKLPSFNKGPTIRRLEGFPTIVYTEENQDSEKKRLVLKSQQELDDFLNTIDKTGLLTMKDKINFEKEYLIAVATDVEAPEDHKVKIRKVYEDKKTKTLLVSITETFPNDDCAPELAPHIGVDIVAINKTDWKIDFEKVKDVLECKAEDEIESSTSSPQSGN